MGTSEEAQIDQYMLQKPTKFEPRFVQMKMNRSCNLHVGNYRLCDQTS